MDSGVPAAGSQPLRQGERLSGIKKLGLKRYCPGYAFREYQRPFPAATRESNPVRLLHQPSPHRNQCKPAPASPPANSQRYKNMMNIRLNNILIFICLLLLNKNNYVIYKLILETSQRSSR